MNLLSCSKSKLLWPLIITFIVLLAAQLTAAPAWVGNVIGNSIPANYTTYWNQVTPENASKWGSVEGTRDSMNWGSVDSYYNFAKQRGFPFKFHCLVWGNQAPGWMDSLSTTDALAEVTEWIQAVAAKYPDAEMIDVVNEPLHAKPNWRTCLGGEGSSGWDWVIKAFQLARQYCKNSKLLINEYGVENDPTACRNYVTIINLLKAQNLVDGIGIQSHCFNLDTLSNTTFNQCLSLLDATGLPIYVSELDLTGDDATQLSRYKDKFPILYNHPKVVGITLWGYIVGQTWKDQTGLVASGSVGASERPALQWLKANYLLKQTAVPTPTPTRTPTPTPTTGKMGDVNGDNSININDALLIAQYSAGYRPANFNTALADVDRNGSIQITDALRVAQCSAGTGGCTF